MVSVASTEAEVGKFRECCRLAAMVRCELENRIKPGLETRDLDVYVEKRLSELGAKSAFKGYRGYPANLCVSINEEVVHGIPGKRMLRQGDLVSLDIGVVYNGFYADTAFSLPVGGLDETGMKLLEVTRGALFAGIAQARAGNHVSDISHAIQSCVEREGLSVVREFVGHGIGRAMHEDPQIPNFGAPGRGMVLVKGQGLAIEPMVNEGGYEVKVRGDGWTAVTADGRRSAHFEHTVLVTDGEPEILTGVMEEGVA